MGDTITNKIIKLDKSIVELIAAGEVVERPASAIKELVENSIDAGATAITIEIRGGGTSYIRVADNGGGIKKEDVKTAFLRNATSKIKTKDDLIKIGTLGFRGEALASISAVSKVSMITRTIDEELATKIQIDGGVVESFEPYGSVVGTTLVIKEMFYNTPARMKFLKSDIVEANAISVTMDRLALSHPKISFKFIRDKKMVLFTPGNNDLLSTIHAVFGKEITDGLIKTQAVHEGVEVSGYISKTDSSRGNRSMQVFFVNNRYVKTVTARVALEEAYKNSIMKGRFPFCVLFINLPWEDVDVNTHPAKIEIRFVNEKPIYQSVYYAVKTGLNKENQAKQAVINHKDFNYEAQKLLQKNKGLSSQSEQLRIDEKTIRPQEKMDIETFKKLGLDKEKISFSQPTVSYTNSTKNIDDSKSKLLFEKANIEYKESVTERESLYNKLNNIDLSEIKTGLEGFNHNNVNNLENIKHKSFSNMDIRFIGEAFSTYIIAQTKEAIYLIDKHAAHERIIFEELKSNQKNQAQVLLDPVAVNLSKDIYGKLIEKKDKISEMGITIEDFGQGTLLVREFPTEMENANIIAVIEEIGENLVKGKKDITPMFMEDIYNSIACKKAIKASDRNSDAELIELLNILSINDEIKHCPHGRPVIIELEKKEIEKKFGRN